MSELKILELFGGIGACTKALERQNIPHKVVDYVEIDKYAVKSYNAVHGTDFEPQDITKWDKNIEVDLIMHGSPCQDFSIAGRQAGGDENSGTRSSLMYETLRIVEKLKPKYVIWENVKNLLSKKHRHNFDAYLKAMQDLGYVSKYQVLNAKNYGIPQNRERVFTVSIRNDIEQGFEFRNGDHSDNSINRIGGLYDQATRWGVYDKNGLSPTLTASMGEGGGYIPMVSSFEFPDPFPLEKKLKDILDDNVDEKYYLTDLQLSRLLASSYDQNKRIYDTEGVSPTINTMGGGQRQPKIIDDTYGYESSPREYEEVSPTLRSSRQGLKVAIKTANTKGYDFASDGDGIDLAYPNSTTRRGRVGHGVAKTLATGDNQGTLDGMRIRKLTPKECWRLMGFDDEDFARAERVNSNTQLYKQAGNSIVVNVLEAIMKNLLGKEYYEE